jgi:hypothetical protein
MIYSSARAPFVNIIMPEILYVIPSEFPYVILSEAKDLQVISCQRAGLYAPGDPSLALRMKYL